MNKPALILVGSALAFTAVATLPSQQDPTPTVQDSKPGAKTEDSCVIVKRMGPADEITSHLYSFGIRGKQFQYIEGTFPKGTKFHGRLTDNDVRHILEKGGKVRILEPKYSQSDLDPDFRFETR